MEYAEEAVDTRTMERIKDQAMMFLLSEAAPQLTP
jgi:hypothetical protein